MLEVLPDHIQARYRRHAMTLSNRAIRCLDRKAQPGMVWAIARSNDHCADLLFGKIEPGQLIG